MNTITIKSDGGARGNPGPAAIAFVAFENQQIIKQHQEYIGESTNNVAEYKAVISGLQWAYEYTKGKDHPIEIKCILDSNLVVNQLQGNFKIKQTHLQTLANQAFQIIQKFPGKISFNHVKREFNKEPDALLNQALDAHQA